jgi:hypothetical protein
MSKGGSGYTPSTYSGMSGFSHTAEWVKVNPEIIITSKKISFIRFLMMKHYQTYSATKYECDVCHGRFGFFMWQMTIAEWVREYKYVCSKKCKTLLEFQNV